MNKYPLERPITLVVPHGRGGSTDIAVRALTKNAERFLGAPIHVLNLAGINGAFALDLMTDSIHAMPDGYSMSTANSSVILSPIVGQTKYVYMEEIRPLLMYAHAPFVFACRADSPYARLETLVRYANANPLSVRCGGSGVGNVSHVLTELFCAFASIRFDVRNYDSGKELGEALSIGEVDCAVSNAVDLREAITDGRARVLAVASEEASPLAPTFREQGYDIVAELRQGIGVSVRVEETRYRFLHEAFAEMARMPDALRTIKDAGMQWQYLDGETYRALWAREDQRMRSVLSGEIGKRVRDAVLAARK